MTSHSWFRWRLGATSHYLNKCWLKSMTLYGVTRRQWVIQDLNIATVLPAYIWHPQLHRHKELSSLFQNKTCFRQWTLTLKLQIIFWGFTILSKWPTRFRNFRRDMWLIIKVTSYWAWWRLKSPALRLFYSTVYSGTDQRKHQSSTSLAFVRVIHRGPVNSPHK